MPSCWLDTLQVRHAEQQCHTVCIAAAIARFVYISGGPLDSGAHMMTCGRGPFESGAQMTITTPARRCPLLISPPTSI